LVNNAKQRRYLVLLPWLMVASAFALIVMSFFAYDADFRGGVRVAVGDLNGDGTPDIVTGPGDGGGPHVKAFSVIGGPVIASFMAYDDSLRYGINVAVGS